MSRRKGGLPPAAARKHKRPDNAPNPYRSGMRDWKRNAAGATRFVPQATHQAHARMDSSAWGVHRAAGRLMFGGARLVQHRTRMKARSGGGIDRNARTAAAMANRARNDMRQAARFSAVAR